MDKSTFRDSLFHDPAVRAVQWRDLRAVTAGQVVRGLLLTPPWLALSFWLAGTGHVVPALAASAVFFLAGLRQAHDAFHRTLGLPRRATDVFLAVLSLAMAVPLHAVKFNHLRHHACPLGPGDVEGMCARMPAWRAIAAGPWFTVRLIGHALRAAPPGVRRWIVLELATLGGLVAVAAFGEAHLLRFHLLVMGLGNCLTGFFAVWLVHHDCEPAGVFARTQRGRWVNVLTLNLLYHLEHHLFPAVPACRLPELARRLDAALPAAARAVAVVGPGARREARAVDAVRCGPASCRPQGAGNGPARRT